MSTSINFYKNSVIISVNHVNFWGKSVYDGYIHEMTITVISTCTWTQKYENFSFVI